MIYANLSGGVAPMRRAAAWVFVVIASPAAFGQGSFRWPSTRTPASPGWPFGPPRNRVNLEGLLARSDGETLSIELSDQRVVRFRLTEKTRYKPDDGSGDLGAFHVSDFVEVESEVDGQGYLEARTVRFGRKAAPDERAEILQCPETMQRWRENVLRGSPADGAKDDRRLSLVTKPQAIPENSGGPARPHASAGNDLISSIRAAVQEAFEQLSSFRARQVTSMFHSSSKPVKWIPDRVVAAEIAYEENRELYSDIHMDGKRPSNAPETGDSDYMRSLDMAWSTGDFETISHCVFSELQDTDFHRTGVEHGGSGDLILYEFAGQRSSGCVALKFKSQITYPAYTGSMKVDEGTNQVVHIDMEATEIPAAFPLDRAERSLDMGPVKIGNSQYHLPLTAYWFGCFRNTYSCFLNRMDFQNYRRFETDSTVSFGH